MEKVPCGGVIRVERKDYLMKTEVGDGSNKKTFFALKNR